MTMYLWRCEPQRWKGLGTETEVYRTPPSTGPGTRSGAVQWTGETTDVGPRTGTATLDKTGVGQEVRNLGVEFVRDFGCP